MLYDLVQGPVELKIIAQVANSGGRAKLPEKIRNKPQLEGGLGLFYEAYWDLVTCRIRQGTLIPWTAVNSWADSARLDEPARRLLHFYVRKMDLAFLAWLRDKSAKESKRKAAPDGDA